MSKFLGRLRSSFCTISCSPLILNLDIFRIQSHDHTILYMDQDLQIDHKIVRCDCFASCCLSQPASNGAAVSGVFGWDDVMQYTKGELMMSCTIYQA